MSLPEHSPLGKPSAYKTEYDPTLLFPIPRQPKRTEIGLPEGKAVPFFGVDIWNAYEVSWLNLKGKPQVRLPPSSFRPHAEHHRVQVVQAVPELVQPEQGRVA